MKHRLAVIFDMDGVIIDNNSFHEIAWKEFCHHHNIALSENEMRKYVFGRLSKDTLAYIFKRDLTLSEIEAFVNEKENIYQNIYKLHIKEVTGLTNLLIELRKNLIPVSLATSAPPENIDFVFSHIPIKEYFLFILDATHINRGKPNSEIYDKAIERLSIPPGKCIVFEDSISGIQAAKSAGAKVIGLSTTHASEELTGTDKVIRNFKEIDLLGILEIVNK